MQISKRKVEDVSFIVLDNQKGMRITLSSFGASIYQLEVIDKYKRMESVVLTPIDLSDFYTSDGYFGKSVGRFAGRIDEARCVIDDKEYILEKNWNGINSLHGGYKGISFSNFDYQIKEQNEYVDVIFTFIELEDKLPGDVRYTITYRVMKDINEFTILFDAFSNKKTIINLTNHAYFNLSGDGKRTILDQKLKLYCDKYTNLNNNLITNSVNKVNKIMNFQFGHKIGKYIEDESLQNHKSFGYDHCFIKKDLNKDIIAILSDRKSKRRLTVYTSLPTVVCYSTNYPLPIDFNVNSTKINKYHAITLECQFIPNGINMNDEESALFEPNHHYNHYVRYHFDLI